MKITFKKYDDLKAYYSDTSKDGKTIVSTQQNAVFNTVMNKNNYVGLDKNFDQFLKDIAGNEYKVQDFKITGGKKLYSIDVSHVGHDGGENRNYPFDNFQFSEDVIDKDDFEGKEYWFCGDCDMVVNPDEQRYFFNTRKTIKEVGIENAVCPLCQTKHYREVKEKN